MATLSAIAFNLVGSVGVFTVTMITFGCAMKSQNTFIAARCTARPPTVIYNPSPYRHPSQDRGNPTLGWILWVMRLTYDTMLRGVPGTGTRDGGLSGALLTVNLDGIVLLRFHHLCLRVCTLACFLYLVVVLPLYATAQCSRIGGDYDSPECQGDNYNLTDYERLTLTNVPTLTPESTDDFGDVLLNWFLPVHSGNLARLYAVVFVTWIVTYYALRELKLEWGVVLAMRRVYYLEADHWKDRKEELQHTLLRVEREKYQRRNSGHHSTAQKTEEDESYLTDRKPWIPHPEQRDTVPNVELYSVLIGGLPSLPTQVVDEEEVGAIFSRKQSIDWQLSVTAAFFDHCVPNQPGFSSSIAAVTILPSAEHLGEAWNQWYRVAGKLRRLRFIRKEISKRKRFAALETGVKHFPDIEQGGGNAVHQEQFSPPSAPMPTESRPKQTVYTQSAEKKEYYQEVLGSTDDLQVESRLLFGLGFGPEQTASYSREFALGAANLAPYGWHEERVSKASTSELLQMERLAVEQVHEANVALREAQERIAEDHEDDSEDDISQEDIHTIMQHASSKGASASVDEEQENNGYSGTSPSPTSKIFDRRASTASSSGEFGTDDEDSFFGGSSSGSSYNQALSGDDHEVKRSDSNPRRTVNRSKSIDSTRSGGSNDSYEFSKKSARKSMILGMGGMKKSVMGLVRTNSNESLKSLDKLPGERTKKPSKAKISSAQLPSDLGLEAGLWMEHIASRHGGANHGGRNRSTPKRTSALGASMHGIHRDRFSGKKTRSAPKRTRSSDDIDLFEPQPQEDISPSNLFLNDQPPKSTMKRALSSDNVDLLADAWDAETNPCNGQANSIWDRLAEEKARKQKLRDRLSDMQTSIPPATPSGNNAIELTSPSSDRVREYRSDVGPRNERPEHATHTTTRTPSDSISAPQSIDDGSRSDERQSDSIPRPHIHPHTPKMKSLHEDTPDDDDSVDMNALAITAQAYGYNVDHRAVDLGASIASFSSHQVEDNLRIARDFEEKAGLRHRDVGGDHEETEYDVDEEDKWTRVMAIIQESSRDKKIHHETKERLISSGGWRVPTFRGIVHAIRKKCFSAWAIFKLRIKPPEIVDDLVRDSSYAVVTFTSRQAAVAARHCLADSRGHDRWVTSGEIPSPPLADAPVCNMSSFRGCVRPVTLSISDKQKVIRHTLAMGTLVAVYFFYTIPLTAAQQLVSPESLSRIFPDIQSLQENSVFLSNIFSGLIPGLVLTFFFAICPPMFKIIANFGSNATSSVTAENSALSYFWWFMVLSAFTGTSLTTAIIDGFNEGLNLGSEIRKVVETTASAIPSKVSATWLNWMIIRVFAVLPTQYLLQLNTFIFSCLGLKCCARTVRGGGAGGPVPYRIYVDSGVVMLCVFALAPASPLIAPAAYAYFLFCTPMLRWTTIFLYRPKFDIGGGRFPFIFDICISGMVVGQILLVTMMTLKAAIGPAVAAFCPLIPTIWFRYFVRRRYLRAFSDAALLQTSLLDGWDNNVETSQEKREEFRRFLVDCHKAAYVPVCIAGDQSTMITAEPSVVVPAEFDDDYDHTSVHDETEHDALDPSHRGEASTYKSEVSSRMLQQPGAMSRRSSTYQPPTVQMGAMMRRASTLAIQQRVTMEHRFRTDGAAAATPFSPLGKAGLGSPRKRVTRQSSSQKGQFLSPLVSTRKSSFKTAPIPQLPSSPII